MRVPPASTTNPRNLLTFPNPPRSTAGNEWLGHCSSNRASLPPADVHVAGRPRGSLPARLCLGERPRPRSALCQGLRLGQVPSIGSGLAGLATALLPARGSRQSKQRRSGVGAGLKNGSLTCRHSDGTLPWTWGAPVPAGVESPPATPQPGVIHSFLLRHGGRWRDRGFHGSVWPSEHRRAQTCTCLFPCESLTAWESGSVESIGILPSKKCIE